MLLNKPYLLLSHYKDEEIDNIIQAVNKKAEPFETALHLTNYLYKILNTQHIKNKQTDERVVQAITFINENLTVKESVSLTSISSKMRISTSRMRHLFKEETGMPISQYILWKRIKKVLGMAYNRAIPIAVCCRMYNFPDQSHFNHMCIKTLGITPLSFLTNFRFIQ